MWTSSGGSSYSSTYSGSYGGVPTGFCGNPVSGGWVANNAAGTSGGTIPACQLGFVITLTYNVDGGAATDSIVLTVVSTPACTSVAPQATVTSATSGNFYAYAYGVSSSVTSVQFPTWGNPGGQDDIVWYNATNLGGGTWRATVNLANHKFGSNEYGTFNTHVYMNAPSYPNVFCGATTWVRDRDPIGALDSATCSLITGWTFDPDDTPTSLTIHVYKNGPAGGGGSFVGGYTANVSRPDINTAYGITGNHGYSFATPTDFMTGSAVPLYIYAVNTSGGNNPLIGNSSLTCAVPLPPPNFNLSNKDVTAVGGVAVSNNPTNGIAEAQVSGKTIGENSLVSFAINIVNSSTGPASGNFTVVDTLTNLVPPTGGWSNAFSSTSPGYISLSCDGLACNTAGDQYTIGVPTCDNGTCNDLSRVVTFTVTSTGGTLGQNEYIAIKYNALPRGPTVSTANIFRFTNEAAIKQGAVTVADCTGLPGVCPLRIPLVLFFRDLSSPFLKEVQ